MNPAPDAIAPIGFDLMWTLCGAQVGIVATATANIHTADLETRDEVSPGMWDRHLASAYVIAVFFGLASLAVAAMGVDLVLRSARHWPTGSVAGQSVVFGLVLLFVMLAQAVACLLFEPHRHVSVVVVVVAAVASVTSFWALWDQKDVLSSCFALVVALFAGLGAFDSQFSAWRVNRNELTGLRGARMAALLAIAVTISALIFYVIQVARLSGSAATGVVLTGAALVCGASLATLEALTVLGPVQARYTTQNSPVFNSLHDWTFVCGGVALGATLPLLLPHQGVHSLAFILAIIGVGGVNFLITTMARNSRQNAVEGAAEQHVQSLPRGMNGEELKRRIDARMWRQYSLIGAIVLVGWVGYALQTSSIWGPPLVKWIADFGSRVFGLQVA